MLSIILSAIARADEAAVDSADSTVPAAFNGFFPHQVTLTNSNSGSFTVPVTVGGVADQLLLDTGASMVTISPKLFAKIRRQSEVTRVSQIGARMASGQIQLLNVYRVSQFRLGEHCELGAVEVAVLPSGDRSLLGMNVLRKAAPFAVSTAPPALGLSNCGISLAAR